MGLMFGRNDDDNELLLLAFNSDGKKPEKLNV
jgi:hypothetical protein